MVDDQAIIEVSIPEQRLALRRGGQVLFSAETSTARNGAGELIGSECTPRGWHVIRARIGAGLPVNTVFVARRPTGEIYTPALREQHPGRDWILTRILWLSGLEVGKNRLGNVDTMRRYVYLHGCPDDDVLGIPGSHGCVKLHNNAMVELFERVPTGTRVVINA
jgi:lipoprotein-anchoring transpeptidase ErfK/SrfK